MVVRISIMACSLLFSVAAVQAFDTTVDTVVAATTKAINEVHVPKPKKLTSSHLSLLGTVFKSNMPALVCIGMTSRRAREALQSIEQFMDFNEQKPSALAEATFAKKKMAHIIAPAISFFDGIKEYHEHITPLIVQSVVTCPHLADDPSAVMKKSYLIRFFQDKQFQVQQDQLPAFFAKEINSVKSLRAVSFEIAVFLQDLFASLPDEVKDLFKQYSAELTRQKAEQKNAPAA